MTTAAPVRSVKFSPPPPEWKPWGGAIGPEGSASAELFPTPVTPLQKKAVELRDAYEARRRYAYEVIEQEWQDAAAAVQLAQTALREAETRAAEEAAPIPSEVREKLRAAIDAADRESFQRRASTARQIARDEMHKYESYLKENAAELLSELREEADKVAAEYRAAEQEFEKRAAPIRERHGALHGRVTALAGQIEGVFPDDISSDFSEPPFPTSL